jgi:hypothetical protein
LGRWAAHDPEFKGIGIFRRGQDFHGNRLALVPVFRMQFLDDIFAIANPSDRRRIGFAVIIIDFEIFGANESGGFFYAVYFSSEFESAGLEILAVALHVVTGNQEQLQCQEQIQFSHWSIFVFFFGSNPAVRY